MVAIECTVTAILTPKFDAFGNPQPSYQQQLQFTLDDTLYRRAYIEITLADVTVFDRLTYYGGQMVSLDFDATIVTSTGTYRRQFSINQIVGYNSGVYGSLDILGSLQGPGQVSVMVTNNGFNNVAVMIGALTGGGFNPDPPD